MKAVNVVKTAAWLVLLAGIAAAQLKYVAVVETELDENSGAAAKFTRAEVRQITAELRREAVNNLLPRERYNIMTSETVYAQGSAVLEECAEENCVITLGARIGADYIVRGVISKFQTKLTLSVEMYETENGNLVASSDPVRSEKPAELLELATAACAKMYRTFAEAQNAVQKKPVAVYTISAAANPPDGGSVTRNPNHTYYTSGTSVNLMATPASGYEFTGWTGDAEDTASLITLIMDDDKTLTADFRYTLPTYTLTTNVFPLDGGSVTRNPDKETYKTGEKVGVTAAPSEGYAFTGWTGAASAATNNVTITMDEDKTLTANFYQKTVQPPPAPVTPPAKKHTLAAASLDILGAGILLYGLNRESNVKDNIAAELWSDAEKSVKQRNVAYTLGTIILLSGITVHIFF